MGPFHASLLSPPFEEPTVCVTFQQPSLCMLVSTQLSTGTWVLRHAHPLQMSTSSGTGRAPTGHPLSTR